MTTDNFHHYLAGFNKVYDSIDTIKLALREEFQEDIDVPAILLMLDGIVHNVHKRAEFLCNLGRGLSEKAKKVEPLEKEVDRLTIREKELTKIVSLARDEPDYEEFRKQIKLHKL